MLDITHRLTTEIAAGLSRFDELLPICLHVPFRLHAHST